MIDKKMIGENNMSSIEPSIRLYEMIIARLKRSGNAPNQLKAYEGSLECIRQCATAEEATAALAASPWYTAVAQGLALDDLLAKRRAAAEQNMADVVEVYDAKISDVSKDYLKAWDTTYVPQIQEKVNRHVHEKEQQVQAHLNEIEAKIKAMENIAVDISEDWADIQAHQQEIVTIGKEELKKLSRASAIVTAPKDKTGKYAFECTPKEAF